MDASEIVTTRIKYTMTILVMRGVVKRSKTEYVEENHSQGKRQEARGNVTTTGHRAQ